MTIYYIDPEGGDDTKDGLSFANRWKTLKKIGNGSVASSLGDEFRLMASREPYEIGNGTWVDNQEYVTLAEQNYLIVDPATTGWNGAAPNVVNTLASSTSTEVYLTNSQQIVMPSADFVGKLAYRTLPATLDLSSWSALSLLIMNAQNWPITFKLCLCSDTTGDVSLVEFPIEAFRSTKYPALLSNGSALPSGVKSISLWATSVPAGSGTFNTVVIENIIAVKGPGEPKHISHGTVLQRVGDDSPEWMPIRGFQDGGKVFIGGTRAGAGVAWKKWRGTGGTTVVKAMQPTKLRWLRRYEDDLNSANKEFDFSGGWSRTDMSAITGVTWLHGENAKMLNGGSGSANPDLPSAADRPQRLFNQPSGTSTFGAPLFYTVKGIGFIEFSDAPWLVGYYQAAVIDCPGLVSVKKGITLPAAPSNMTYGFIAWQAGGAFTDAADGSGDTDRIYSAGQLSYKVNKVVAVDTNWVPPANLAGTRFTSIKKIHNCTYGMSSTAALGRETGYTRLIGSEFRWNSYDIQAGNADVVLESCTPLNADGTEKASFGMATSGRKNAEVRTTGVGGRAWDNRVYNANGRFSQVLEGAGRVPGKRTLMMSGAFTVQNEGRLPYRMREQVALVAVKAGVPATVSAYIKQQSWYSPEHESSLTLRQKSCICTIAGLVPGVDRVEGINIQKGNKWGRVVITFTSSVDALVPIFFETETYQAWCTECGLDDSGLPPDPIIVPGPPALTDSFRFNPAYELFSGVYDIYSAGSQKAEDVFANALGARFATMHTGTVVEAAPGNIIGAALFCYNTGAEVSITPYIVVSPGWPNAGQVDSAMYVLFDETANVELGRIDQQAFNAMAGQPPDDAYAIWVTSPIFTVMPVVGHVYRLDVYRGES